MPESFEDYCARIYGEFLTECETTLTAGMTDISDSRQECIVRESQKYAIRKSYVKIIQDHPEKNYTEIWKVIKDSHLKKKSGINDIGVITRVLSAEQSWKKSSGHAFEEMMKEESRIHLQPYGIELVLQRDLTDMLARHEIANEPTDLLWFKSIEEKKGIFDLYAIATVDDQKKVFGCIQCKTSIRDRVKGDREFSKSAMDAGFWSIACVLDGDFLNLPEFYGMVNGMPPKYNVNGWHSVYDLSGKVRNGRIFPDNLSFDTFKNHANKAKEDWIRRRHLVNPAWKPDVDYTQMPQR